MENLFSYYDKHDADEVLKMARSFRKHNAHDGDSQVFVRMTTGYDLNTCMDERFYVAPTDAITRSLVNAPARASATGVIVGNAVVFNIVNTYDSSTVWFGRQYMAFGNCLFMRYYEGAHGWWDWEAIVEEQNGVTTRNLDIISTSETTLTAKACTWYKFSSEVSTLSITLPTGWSNSVSMASQIKFQFTTGSTTPSVTFSSASGTIVYQTGYAIEADKTYIITADWNAGQWIISYITIG